MLFLKTQQKRRPPDRGVLPFLAICLFLPTCPLLHRVKQQNVTPEMFFLTLKARRRVPAVKHAGADDPFHQILRGGDPSLQRWGGAAPAFPVLTA